MEDIAREARVSRASIYFHFGSKDQVFRALAQRLHDHNLSAMRDAAAAPAGRGADPRGALEARLGSFVDYTHSSPHGDELLDEHNRVCGDIAAASREVALKILRALVREATTSGELDPAGVGLVPQDGCRHPARLRRGCENQARRGPRAFRRRLEQIVRTLVAGMRPQPARAPAP